METSSQATIVKIAVKQAAGESKRNVEIENNKRETERQRIEVGFPQLNNNNNNNDNTFIRLCTYADKVQKNK